MNTVLQNLDPPQLCIPEKSLPPLAIKIGSGASANVFLFEEKVYRVIKTPFTQDERNLVETKGVFKSKIYPHQYYAAKDELSDMIISEWVSSIFAFAPLKEVFFTNSNDLVFVYPYYQYQMKKDLFSLLKTISSSACNPILVEQEQLNGFVVPLMVGLHLAQKQLGLVHSDCKPENVMFNTQIPKDWQFISNPMIEYQLFPQKSLFIPYAGVLPVIIDMGMSRCYHVKHLNPNPCQFTFFAYRERTHEAYTVQKRISNYILESCIPSENDVNQTIQKLVPKEHHEFYKNEFLTGWGKEKWNVYRKECNNKYALESMGIDCSFSSSYDLQMLIGRVVKMLDCGPNEFQSSLWHMINNHFKFELDEDYNRPRIENYHLPITPMNILEWTWDSMPQWRTCPLDSNVVRTIKCF